MGSVLKLNTTQTIFKPDIFKSLLFPPSLMPAELNKDCLPIRNCTDHYFLGTAQGHRHYNFQTIFRKTLAGFSFDQV